MNESQFNGEAVPLPPPTQQQAAPSSQWVDPLVAMTVLEYDDDKVGSAAFPSPLVFLALARWLRDDFAEDRPGWLVPELGREVARTPQRRAPVRVARPTASTSIPDFVSSLADAHGIDVADLLAAWLRWLRQAITVDPIGNRGMPMLSMPRSLIPVWRETCLDYGYRRRRLPDDAWWLAWAGAEPVDESVDTLDRFMVELVGLDAADTVVPGGTLPIPTRLVRSVTGETLISLRGPESTSYSALFHGVSTYAAQLLALRTWAALAGPDDLAESFAVSGMTVAPYQRKPHRHIRGAF